MHRLRVALSVAVGALFLFGCGPDEVTKENLTQIVRSGSRPIQVEAQSDNYVIRIGDQIQISVWDYAEFNTQTVVRELGTIAVPHVGEMQAAGFTKQQFTDELVKKLSNYIRGEVRLTVTIISATPQKVTVMGEVTRQENYPLTNDATLLEVLSAAGGTTNDSDIRNIKILRAGQNRTPIEVDLSWYIENGNVESIPIVRPGDTIFVPKKANVIRELSDFMRDAIFIFGFFRVFN